MDTFCYPHGNEVVPAWYCEPEPKNGGAVQRTIAVDDVRPFCRFEEVPEGESIASRVQG